jgi:RHS repeat-associated protein
MSGWRRFAYSTWGTPTVTTLGSSADLRFRYRYVGRFGVADDATGLAYMQARHYSPELGRFLQPDPAPAESNMYGYTGNSPVTRVDPEGRLAWCAIPVIGWATCAAAVRAVVWGIGNAPRLIAALTAGGYAGQRVGPYILKAADLGHILAQHSQSISNAALRTRDAARAAQGTAEYATKFLRDSRI